MVGCLSVFLLRMGVALILIQGTEKTTHFPIGTWIKEKRAETKSSASFWGAALADFEKLATGESEGVPIMPSADGVPWKFVLLFAKGDEQVRSDEWGLRHHNDAGQCCPHCLADRDAVPWSDLQSTAAWRPTVRAMTAAEFVARSRAPLHPLVASRFTWLSFFYLDVMHVMDCRGVGAVVYGSLVSTFVYWPALGATLGARLDTLNRFMAEWYDLHPGVGRLPKLTSASLVLNGWTELHGPAVKAANSRHAAPLFAAMAREYCPGGTDHENLLIDVTLALEEFYEILANAEMFLSPAELARFSDVTLELGVAMMKLRHLSEGRGLHRWQVKPKVHRMAHLPGFAKCINPRRVSCYSDESHIGTCCKIWKRSLVGRYQSHIQRSALAKRWLSVVLRLELGLR